jgi:hypothetical protein
MLAFSETTNQELDSNANFCEHHQRFNLSHHVNVLENATTYVSNITQTPIHANSTLHNEYYPENPLLYFMYSVAPIWYCLFSVLFVLIFGTLFSLIYSCLKTRSFDADSSFKDERKKYLFFYRIRNYY